MEATLAVRDKYQVLEEDNGETSELKEQHSSRVVGMGTFEVEGEIKVTVLEEMENLFLETSL